MDIFANDNAASAAFTLHLGDCLETMKTMADGSVDLIVTSPPYNLGEGNAVHWHEKGAWRKRPALADGYASHNDAMPYSEYVAWQKALLTEMWRLIPDDGAIFYQHKNRVQKGILRTPHDLNPGLPLRQIVVWNRTSGMNFSKSNFTPSHELIFIFAKPKFRLTKYAADMDVWNIRPDRGSDHPAPYPVELARRCIQHTSAKVVFDPFSGSGTTGVAALELGRQYIGCELDPGYLEASRLRLEGVTQKVAA